MSAIRRIFIFVIIAVTISLELTANIWRSYLSYYQTIAVAQGNQLVFAANENGLFSFNPADNRFETYSRVEGLSDSGISAIGWSTSKGGLIIGYSNGNLDLLLGNTIVNLPDIKLKTTIVNKSIRHIFCEGDFAWLSCDFGIVKINLRKWEVAETWIIGPDASPIAVNELVSDGSFFWAATASGVFKADKNNLNLQDYKSWIFQDQLPFPRKPFNSIAVLNNLVYACDTDGLVYAFDGIAWQSVYPEIKGVQKIKAFPPALVFVCEKSVELISPDSRSAVSTYGTLIPATATINPVDAMIGNTGELWIGDHTFGLVQKTGSGLYRSAVPSSPARNNSVWLTTLGTNLYIATGSDNAASATIGAEIYRLIDQNWYSLNAYSEPKLSGIKNMTRIAPSPVNAEHFWGSTSADGLLEFDGQKTIKIYNSTNSPLESQNGTCQIGGLNYDAAGKPVDKGTLKDGEGTIRSYDENGKLYLIEHFEKGKSVKKENQ